MRGGRVGSILAQGKRSFCHYSVILRGKKIRRRGKRGIGRVSNGSCYRESGWPEGRVYKLHAGSS